MSFSAPAAPATEEEDDEARNELRMQQQRLQDEQEATVFQMGSDEDPGGPDASAEGSGTNQVRSTPVDTKCALWQRHEWRDVWGACQMRKSECGKAKS